MPCLLTRLGLSLLQHCALPTNNTVPRHARTFTLSICTAIPFTLSNSNAIRRTAAMRPRLSATLYLAPKSTVLCPKQNFILSACTAVPFRTATLHRIHWQGWPWCPTGTLPYCNRHCTWPSYDTMTRPASTLYPKLPHHWSPHRNPTLYLCLQ